MSDAYKVLELGGKPVRKGPMKTRFQTTSPVIGFWLFNKASDDDATTRIIGSRNLAPGASNLAKDRRIIGAPTIHDDYWTFGPTDAILTDIAEPDALTLYAIARCTETGVGDTSQNRAQVAGWFGNSQNRGTALYFQSMSAIRGISFSSSDDAAGNLNVPSQTIDKWRIYRMWAAGSGFRLRNITEDSDENEPSSVSVDRVPGTQKFAIGARLEYGEATGRFTKSTDIAAILLTSDAHSSDQQTLIAADLRKQIALTGITEGAA